MTWKRTLAAIAIALPIVLGAGTAWLLLTGDDEPETVVIQAPGGNGREATREEIAAFEAAWDRCERSGAKCAVAIPTWTGTPPSPGWLTPVATR